MYEIFIEQLGEFYAKNSRSDLPWRQPEPDGSFNPYKIVVSELMLQQTQVARVIPKYQQFLQVFPTLQSVAEAPLGEVIKLWSGLGYNRRAKFLQQTAVVVANQYNGQVPDTLTALVGLPGIGKNTAGAILAYAFNQPVIFIETNIRTVYIHHFFADQTAVSDDAITACIAETIDREQPREFYWALMDYGSYLKRVVGNSSKFSQSYTKQSRFEGSTRQLRGKVLRALSTGKKTQQMLATELPDQRLAQVLRDLNDEGLIKLSGDYVYL